MDFFVTPNILNIRFAPLRYAPLRYATLHSLPEIPPPIHSTPPRSPYCLNLHTAKKKKNRNASTPSRDLWYGTLTIPTIAK